MGIRFLRGKGSRITLALSLTALSLGSFSLTAHAADTSSLATLHVAVLVTNSKGGTATPSTFIVHVTKNGQDVYRSPQTGIGKLGRTYTLAPGSYILYQEPKDGYSGAWAGVITAGGTVDLIAGENRTVTRINTDAATFDVAVPHGNSTTEDPAVTTVAGGELPKTSTPFGNLALLGGGLILIGGVGFTTRRVLVK